MAGEANWKVKLFIFVRLCFVWSGDGRACLSDTRVHVHGSGVDTPSLGPPGCLGAANVTHVTESWCVFAVIMYTGCGNKGIEKICKSLLIVSLKPFYKI